MKVRHPHLGVVSVASVLAMKDKRGKSGKLSLIDYCQKHLSRLKDGEAGMYKLKSRTDVVYLRKTLRDAAIQLGITISTRKVGDFLYFWKKTTTPITIEQALAPYRTR